ncbi:hypothetical protein [Nocardioides daejeonensis]|uniref:hypothetical protein n=1 Tax=Nocardioides daejeonensis TaxID=1046556 RepID=UPI0013A58C02|nr:hypothetical protein [Nocardioides daejeonensis]
MRHLGAGRSLRTALVFVASMLLAPVVILVAAAPAHACSCAMGKTADHVEWADRVFTGRVVAVVSPETDAEGEPGDRLQFTSGSREFAVAVDEVFKGEVGAEITLVSAGNSAACGYDTLPGKDEEWVWYAHRVGEEGVPGVEGHQDAWSVNICGGSGPSTEVDLTEIAALTGERSAPTGAGATDASDSTGAASDKGGAGAGEAAGSGSRDAVRWGIGGVLLVVGAGLAGAVLVRRRA